MSQFRSKGSLCLKKGQRELEPLGPALPGRPFLREGGLWRGVCAQRHTARSVDPRTSEGTGAWALHAASCRQVKLG